MLRHRALLYLWCWEQGNPAHLENSCGSRMKNFADMLCSYVGKALQPSLRT